MMVVQRFEDFATKVSADTKVAGRRMWLAGLGAAAVLGDTSQALFGMLVEEGKKYQTHEWKMVDELVQKATDRVRTAGTTVEETVQTTTKVALNRLGMPSRKDVAELTRRVEQLTAKVDTLSRKELVHAN